MTEIDCSGTRKTGRDQRCWILKVYWILVDGIERAEIDEFSFKISIYFIYKHPIGLKSGTMISILLNLVLRDSEYTEFKSLQLYK